MRKGADKPRVAFVVPCYGLDLAGGAEGHCRQVAEHLAERCDVTVLTTCATDKLSWRNSLPAGVTFLKGVRVLRFATAGERQLLQFHAIHDRIFTTQLPPEQEFESIRRQGPDCPQLIEHLKQRHAEYDAFVLFALVSYPVIHALSVIGEKALLVPSLEGESSLYLHILDGVIRHARHVFYNTEEERLLLQRRFVLPHGLGKVVGIGIDPPVETEPDPLWAQWAERLEGRLTLSYLGKVEAGSGCDNLTEYFLRYIRQQQRDDLRLLLLGSRNMPLPPHPSILAPGRVGEYAKDDALRRTTIAVSPSPHGSRCLATLESWMHGKPVLANACCRVLVGHCLRSNGGLWYEDYAEFRECLNLLLSDPDLREKIGVQGRAYVQRGYRWDYVVAAYAGALNAIINGTGDTKDTESCLAPLSSVSPN